MGIVLSSSKVCVTGADGFIGSHLVEALFVAGAELAHVPVNTAQEIWKLKVKLYDLKRKTTS